MRHDLESVFLVLLHIFRFTAGPKGSSKDIKDNQWITRWHNHHDVTISLKELKRLDIQNVLESLRPSDDESGPSDNENVRTFYWTPIYPVLKRMLLLFYAKNVFQFYENDVQRKDTQEKVPSIPDFKSLLQEAKEICKRFEESEPKLGYGWASAPPRPRKRKMADDQQEMARPSPVPVYHYYSSSESSSSKSSKLSLSSKAWISSDSEMSFEMAGGEPSVNSAHWW